MTVISIHTILTGPAIKTRVTLTVIDDGITRFAWIHKTTQIKMNEVTDNTGKSTHFTFPTGTMQTRTAKKWPLASHSKSD